MLVYGLSRYVDLIILAGNRTYKGNLTVRIIPNFQLVKTSFAERFVPYMRGCHLRFPQMFIRPVTALKGTGFYGTIR